MQARSDDGWLRALSGPSKWRTAQGERVVTAWRASGMSMTSFARKHGLNVERIAYWRDRVPSNSAVLARVEPKNARAFVPVLVRPSAESRAASMSLSAGGERIDVFDAQRLDPRWLADLVCALNAEVRR